MAFATSNVQTSVFGNLRITYGDWSGAVGDSSGSIGVSGGRVYLCSFATQDSSGAYVQMPVRFSTSTSGNVTTVTIYNTGAVTTGNFLIVHK